MDDRLDLVMTTWLAREARFYVYVCREELSPSGYKAYKYVMVHRAKREPLLRQWLSDRHEINARRVSRKSDIEKIIETLRPVRELVMDIEGMEKMEHLFHLFPHRWKHEDILRLVNELDDWSDSRLNTFEPSSYIDDDPMAGKIPTPND